MIAGCVLVVFLNHWGKGGTLEEAIKAAKKAGFAHRRHTRKTRGMVYLFSCQPDELTVEADVMVRWQAPKGTIHLFTTTELS